MRNKNQPIPVKIAGAALVGAMAIGTVGCSAQPELPGQNMVVFETGDHKSPTDHMANQIWQAVNFGDKPGDEANIQKAVSEGVLGARNYTSEFNNRYAGLFKSVPYIDYDAKNILTRPQLDELIGKTGAADERIKTALRQKYAYNAAAAAIRAVEYSKAEPGEMGKVLDSYDPGLSKAVRPVLDRGHLLEAVYSIVDVKSKAFKDEIADITTPEVKELADEIAKGKTHPKVLLDFLTQSKDIREKADEEMKKYEGLSRDVSLSDYVSSSDEAQKHDIRAAIAAHNNIRPTELTDIPESATAAKTIDLRGVKGTKLRVDRFYVEKGQQPEVQSQFGEIYAEDGQLVLNFNKDSGLKSEAETQLRKGFERSRPLLEAAFAHGDVLSVRFLVTKDYNGYFGSRPNEIGLELPADNMMSEEQFETLIVHETVHALVNTLFDEETAASVTEAVNVKKACSALSKSAYDQFVKDNSYYSTVLNKMAAQTPEGIHKQALLELAKTFKENKLSELMAKPDYVTNSRYKKNVNLTECGDYTIGDIMYTVYEKLGSKDPSADVKDSNNVYVMNKDYQTFMKRFDESIMMYSLFKKLNESTYVDTQSADKEYLGHSRENARELLASSIDASLTSQDDFSKLIKNLSTTDRAAVLQTIRAGYDVVIHRHPSLKNYLEMVYAKYAIALPKQNG